MNDTTIPQPGDESTWPWRVVELGHKNFPVFYILDCKDAEVARFYGERARRNCELVMEMRAQRDLKQLRQKHEQPAQQLV